MEILTFKGENYQLVNIVPIPQAYREKLKWIEIKQSGCLINSYNVAKRIKNVKIVEGFLLSYFNDGRVESVGHVWNQANGQYFDVTINAANHAELISEHKYYFNEVYTSEKANVKEINRQGGGLYDLNSLSEQLTFKTKVKSLEKEFLEFLNQLQIKGE